MSSGKVLGIASLKGMNLIKARAIRQIVSSKRRGEIFGHTLLTGIGGTGKTAFARAVAEELGYHFVEIEAAALTSRETLIEKLVRASRAAETVGKPLLFFIDEVHRLSVKMQEALYYPMKEFRITSESGDIFFPRFALFAATTRPDMLDEGSFVTRFGNSWDIGRYPREDIEEILAQIFIDWGLTFGPYELESIASRSLGIPRIAHNLAEKIRDQVIYSHPGSSLITKQDVEETFHLEGLDDIGLNELHRKYLMQLDDTPRGLHTISAKMGLNPSIVEERVEPILLALGMVDATPKGRVLTAAGHLHLAHQGLV